MKKENYQIARQIAFNVQTLLLMPGISGEITIGVPGMNIKTMDEYLDDIELNIRFNLPGIKRNGNLFTSTFSKVKIYLKCTTTVVNNG